MLIKGMQGLGDNIYQRAAVREFEGTVWLETSWPELYQDLVNIKPVRPNTKLRTQSKNIEKQKNWHEPPDGLRHVISYDSRGMMRGISKSINVVPKVFDLPSFKESPESGSYVVVRPVTIRSEWRADSRSPLPEYLNEAALQAKELGYKVVSVADLQEGQEWLVGEAPYADVKYHQGELSVKQLMSLVQGASAVIGGIGWLAPAAMAYRVPAWIICGGWGAFNSPENLAIDFEEHEEVNYCMPDNFCRCLSKEHDCDKRIKNHNEKFTEFARKYLPVV